MNKQSVLAKAFLEKFTDPNNPTEQVRNLSVWVCKEYPETSANVDWSGSLMIVSYEVARWFSSRDLDKDVLQKLETI